MKKLIFNDVERVYTDIEEVTNFISINPEDIETLPVNWTKYISLYDLKNQKEPVMIKKENEVFLLFPPFKVDIDVEKEVSFRKGINKKVEKRILNPTIQVSEYLVIGA